MKKKLILSLGSNIEPRDKNIKDAVLLLNKSFCLEKISSIYETAPQDDIRQEYFYNICVIYSVSHKTAFDILHIIKNIERNMGRVKEKNRPKGPRNIDIDILFLGKVKLDTSELTIPHKSMFNRRFVLEPLLEILPENSKYIKKYKLFYLLHRCMNQDVKKR